MLTDERFKELMYDVGLPHSRSLHQALRQCATEAALEEREACARACEGLIGQNEQALKACAVIIRDRGWRVEP